MDKKSNPQPVRHQQLLLELAEKIYLSVATELITRGFKDPSAFTTAMDTSLAAAEIWVGRLEAVASGTLRYSCDLKARKGIYE